MEKQAREITNEKLTELAATISTKFFEHLPYISTNFEHNCTNNNRLRTTAGRFLIPSCNIEVNPKYYARYGQQSLHDVIKHELVHYHLYRLNLGFKHKDKDFKQLCKIVDAPRFCHQMQSPKYRYKCSKCNTEFLRMRKVNVKKYRCGKCKGSLSPSPI
ncbi:SprT family protein [Proteinivorax tanatarense]|uniref:SprT family protein n=1 Tax=Proteinivorax tanatarense TaxID=1260629 RepID=A0AAU7VQA0_9FIRM